MARAYQQKFFTLLEAQLKDTLLPAGLELVLKEQWANTGLAQIQTTTSLEPLVSFKYDFQDRDATLDFSPRGSRWDPQNKDWYSFYYNAEEGPQTRPNPRIKTAMEALDDIIVRVKTKSSLVIPDIPLRTIRY